MVSGAELMAHLKGLVQNAVTYGGMMAIKTLCPQCQDLMEWLDAKADWINSMAKTDCEDMQKLVGGMMSKMAAGSRAASIEYREYRVRSQRAVYIHRQHPSL